MDGKLTLQPVAVVSGIVLVLYFGWSLRTGLIRAALPLSFFTIGFGFAYLFDQATLEKSLSITSVVVVFGCLLVGYFIKYVYDVRFSVALAKNGFVKAARLLFLDFRVVAIIIGLLISILMSFPFYGLAVEEAQTAANAAKLGQQPPGLAGFWLSFHSSWVSSVLFFAVVGLVAGLTALYRPEADVFAARVQILLGGKSGPAVDYIAQKLAEIGYVGRRTTRQILIEDYSPEMHAFRLRVTHSTWIRNLYHDVQAAAAGNILFNFDELTPSPPAYGELVSFRINGASQADLPTSLARSGFKRPWTLNIPGDEEGYVTYEHWCWYRDDIEHIFNLGRFTEEMELEIKSRCAGTSIKVNLKAGAFTKEVMLGYDDEYRLPPQLDKYPGTAAYAFKLAVEPGNTTEEPLNPSQSGIDLSVTGDDAHEKAS